MTHVAKVSNLLLELCSQFCPGFAASCLSASKPTGTISRPALTQKSDKSDGGEGDSLDPEAGRVDAAGPDRHVLVAGEDCVVVVAVRHGRMSLSVGLGFGKASLCRLMPLFDVF